MYENSRGLTMRQHKSLVNLLCIYYAWKHHLNFFFQRSNDLLWEMRIYYVFENSSKFSGYSECLYTRPGPASANMPSENRNLPTPPTLPLYCVSREHVRCVYCTSRLFCNKIFRLKKSSTDSAKMFVCRFLWTI
jgi:hypothetical protein